jgi:hypothetical protein
MHVTGYSDKDCVLDCTNVVWIEQYYSSVISCRFNFLFNKKKRTVIRDEIDQVLCLLIWLLFRQKVFSSIKSTIIFIITNIIRSQIVM